MIVLVVGLAALIVALVVREATVRLLATVIAGVLIAWWLIGWLQTHG